MNQTRDTIPALNALRGLACLLVVMAHAGGLRVFFDIRGAGVIGVMLFFALSGFLMYMLYGEQVVTAASLKRYGIRRFFRVVPAFLFVVILSYIGIESGWFRLYDIDTPELIRHLTLRGEVSVLWTIAVELKFYLLFPVIIALIYVLPGHRSKLCVLTVLYATFALVELEVEKFSLWRFIEFFLAGMIAGALYLHANVSVKARRWIDLAFLVLLVVIVVAIPGILQALLGIQSGLWRDPLPYSLMAGATVLASAWLSPSASRLFANGPLEFIGKVSFSLYLIHLPVMRYLVRELDYDALVTLPLAIGAAVAVAWVMYELIEKPGQKIGYRLEGRDR